MTDTHHGDLTLRYSNLALLNPIAVAKQHIHSTAQHNTHSRSNMFLPGRSAERETAAKKLHFGRVETWCLQIIPAALKQGTDISVQEVQCGDPNCAPIDTMVTMFFER